MRRRLLPFGLELPEFEFSELIESEIESDTNAVADIFREQVESSSKKKNLVTSLLKQII